MRVKIPLGSPPPFSSNTSRTIFIPQAALLCGSFPQPRLEGSNIRTYPPDVSLIGLLYHTNNFFANKRGPRYRGPHPFAFREQRAPAGISVHGSLQSKSPAAHPKSLFKTPYFIKIKLHQKLLLFLIKTMSELYPTAAPTKNCPLFPAPQYPGLPVPNPHR